MKLATIGVMVGLLVLTAHPGPGETSPTRWKDLGIVYGAGSEKAYYPSVIFDSQGFGEGASARVKMWYSDGNRAVRVTFSPNETSWSPAILVAGLPPAHHVQVIYDSQCFGGCFSLAPKYKIWYWNIAEIYSINALGYAESVDGIIWDNAQLLTQDTSHQLVTGHYPDWNYGSYGPIDVIYQAGALNSGTNPWSYSYVMFYDGTSGSAEETGLAYSTDGKHWTAYVGNPVLPKGPVGSWDSGYAVYGTVLPDADGFHYWYSGGQLAAHEGIGYAFSADGLSWVKSLAPIFHITDPYMPYRNERTYTPAVVEYEAKKLLMFYSATGNGADYAIGLAKQK